MEPNTTKYGLPLLELFTQLRQAGLPLGLEEYQSLLYAIQGGFGLPDFPALSRLCKTLWVKSEVEERIFDYQVEQVRSSTRARESSSSLAPSSKITTTASSSSTTKTGPSSTPPPSDHPEVQSTSTGTFVASSTSASPSEVSLQIQDEVQIAKAVLQAASGDDDSFYGYFIQADEYLPITLRQMKQSWRYLRRSVREGPPVELDIASTIKEIGRQGVLLKPVLVPRRTNRSQLLLLIDHGGSMVPFHSLSRRFAETALRGGRLGKADIYYFHNCPEEYLSRDTADQEYELLQDILDYLYLEHTGVLIFSDAGAARGGLNIERVEMTEKFLGQLKLKVRYVAWLNPMPYSRWAGTTAGKIMRSIPMFDLSRRGLDDAISVLRGRPIYID